MDIKQEVMNRLKSGKLEQHHGTWKVGAKDGRLVATVGYEVTVSADLLPGDGEAVLAQALSAFGLGNSQSSQQPTSD